MPVESMAGMALEGCMAEESLLDTDLIQIDPEIQIREVYTTSINGPFNLFKELYCEQGPGALPPVVVFHDIDGVHWLADGHYRLLAFREVFDTTGPREIPAEVRDGSKRDAIFYATGANSQHAKRLTNKEMRIAVWRLLQDPEWGEWSDREIARHVGASHVFVAKVRKQYAEFAAAASGNRYQILHVRKVVRRGGKPYLMETKDIGPARGVPIPMPLISASITAGEATTGDDEFEPADRSGLNFLMLAWKRAESEERRAFRAWIQTQPDDDAYELVEISTPEIEQIRMAFEHAREATGVQASMRVTQLRLKAGNNGAESGGEV